MNKNSEVLYLPFSFNSFPAPILKKKKNTQKLNTRKLKEPRQVCPRVAGSLPQEPNSGSWGLHSEPGSMVQNKVVPEASGNPAQRGFLHRDTTNRVRPCKK